MLAFTAHQGHAQTTTLLHYWSFNGITAAAHNPSIPAIHATYSVLDTNKANVVYHLVSGASSTYAGYIDNVAGDTMNARMSTAAGNGLRVRNPSDSMDLRVFAPTTGYHGNVSIKYEVQSSSTTSGQLAQLFDYSTDSGATWKTSGLNMTIDSISQAQFQGTSWGLISLNFNNDTTVRNNAGFVFRIKFAGNTSLASGNNRFDNMTVESTTTVTVPNAVANVSNEAGEMLLYPNPATNTLYVKTGSDALKTVVIYNLSGQRMTVVSAAGKDIAVNIAAIPAGTYYAYVITGNRTEVKTFVKQ
ncbi:T9SS type A sorting domain-containing protein [Chitinophagaceae bacterium MMS25-I14]